MPLTSHGRSVDFPRIESDRPERPPARLGHPPVARPARRLRDAHRLERVAFAPGPSALPRLLLGVSGRGALSLSEHMTVHGEMPMGASRRHAGKAALIDRVDQAGLLGRGGAGFPTAVKMRAVAGSRGRPVVVVNGSEGEPASAKDRLLLDSVPHLVLDGAVLAAHALGAHRVLVCVGERALATRETLRHAIEERTHAGIDPATLELIAVPERFITGQESALVSHLNGGAGLPTFTPPLPFQRGVDRRPTLVNNAETLAHMALIERHGPQWFRELGTETQPGSMLVTVSGALSAPGVYEIAPGMSLGALIEAAGGAVASARAVLLGGYFGSWVAGNDAAGLALSRESLATHGASLGAGVVAVLDHATCVASEATAVARWLSDQSAGQCGPCVHGLAAIAGALEELRVGSASPDTEQRVRRWAALTERRGACAHPDGAVRFIASALDVFADEFADHAAHGVCDACSQTTLLPTPVTRQGRVTPTTHGARSASRRAAA